MITNLELYGTDDVPKVDKKTCNRRLELLEEHMQKLISVHFMKQDNRMLNEVMKAKRHWTRLRDGEEPN